MTRIADALEAECEARKTDRCTEKLDRQHERFALLLAAAILILAITDFSSLASQITQYATILKDYGPLSAAILLTFLSITYRAFRLGLVRLEMLVGVCLAEWAVTVLIFFGRPLVQGDQFSQAVVGATAFIILLAFLFQFVANRARAVLWGGGISILLFLMLGAVGLLKTTVGGTNWLAMEFVNQRIVTIDSAFPYLVLLDVLAALAGGTLILLGVEYGLVPLSAQSSKRLQMPGSSWS